MPKEYENKRKYKSTKMDEEVFYELWSAYSKEHDGLFQDFISRICRIGLKYKDVDHE